MKIFICGQRSFGKAVLEALLADGHDVVGVAPSPTATDSDALVQCADENGVPVISNCVRLTPDLLPMNTDLIVAAHSHWYISSELLACTTYGGIGFHPSLLPRHRGKDAVRWAIAMGDPVSGGSVYQLTDHVDGGYVIAQRLVFIGRDWDHHRLWREIFPEGVKLICEAANAIDLGCATYTIQNEEFATWEPAFGTASLKQKSPCTWVQG